METKKRARLSLKDLLFGKPKDPLDPKVFHQVSLIAFLAWVGLGADGLSSSAYGPEEAYLALGEHSFLALPLAILMAITVFVISASYSQIIELFPTGGGGYLVGTKLLGPQVGVISGSALVVDYMLTITISVASAGDQLFSFLPSAIHGAKLGVEFVLILLLIYLNLRGTKESVLFLLPIFLLFVVAHVFRDWSGSRAQSRGSSRTCQQQLIRRLSVISKPWDYGRLCLSFCMPTALAAARTPVSKRSATAFRRCASPELRPGKGQ